MKQTRWALLTTFVVLAVAGTLGAAESKILASGEFEGRSNHVVTGAVSLLQMGDSVLVVLAPDFSLDNAPDPKVALGKDGYDPATLLSPLESNDGAQMFELPSDIRPEEYNEVWIWCEKFEVPLGVAFLRTPTS